MTEASYPLPRPISVNNMFANVPGKGRVRSASYCTWANAAGWVIKSGGPIRRISGPVRVDLRIVRPRTTMDLDNAIKGYLDLLVSLGAIDDDRCVHAISAAWAKEGRVMIRSME